MEVYTSTEVTYCCLCLLIAKRESGEITEAVEKHYILLEEEKKSSFSNKTIQCTASFEVSHKS